MRIYIDTMTGTWGDAEDIVFINAEDGPETAMLLNTVENLSDSEIMEYGNKWGDAPILSNDF